MTNAPDLKKDKKELQRLLKYSKKEIKEWEKFIKIILKRLKTNIK